jgi:NAD(P)-dependent dehydrogenase (short-subunit alcohol dehydrogenase family)
VVVPVDVSRAQEVERLCARAVETYGRLDCAFNNAGIIGQVGPLLADVPEENWSRVCAVNLTGVFLCMKYEIPLLLRSGGGAIVNASSSVGLVGDRTYAAYVASKHGVVGATRAAALEYADRGIRINAVCPGPTRTELVEALFAADPEVEATLAARQPVGRLASPAEIAQAVVWLCSDEASFVTGHALAVDGGQVIQ